MVFSLFGRWSKADTRKARSGPVPGTPDTTQRGPITGSNTAAGAIAPVDQRELARRTAEKIDQIESEMIAGPLVPPAPVRAPVAPAAPVRATGAASSAPRGGSPAAAATPSAAARGTPDDGYSTSLVLGDAAAAAQIHVNGSGLSPDIEEAAILFANGQAAAASSALQRAIARGDLGTHEQQAWMMLFDILQFAGDRTTFESTAIDFAARFEQSPPAWRELGGESPPPADRRTPAAAMVGFPAVLDDAVLARLAQVQRAASTRRVVTLELSATESVTPEAAARLVEVIGTFERAQRELVVLGAERLYRAARARIEPGRRDPDQSCWMLALLALRVLGKKQEFDDLSIDYCVTYEVSPPAWEPMPAGIRHTPPREPALEERTTAAAAPAEGTANAFVLRGEVTGRIQGELASLREHAGVRSSVVIDCRELSRLDFIAAGELLNEIVTLRSTGKSVLIVEPHHAVLALMIVMGIHELAEIRRRK